MIIKDIEEKFIDLNALEDERFAQDEDNVRLEKFNEDIGSSQYKFDSNFLDMPQSDTESSSQQALQQDVLDKYDKMMGQDLDALYQIF